MEWLNFITSEIHKAAGVLFIPNMPEEAKAIYREKILGRFAYVDQQLEGKQFLMGDTFTVADCYLFVVTNWTKPLGLDISGLKHLNAHHARVGARPSAQAAMKHEGLTK
jgi:glutathione S-transferase